MSFNDLLKQYQVTPDEPKPAQPLVKAPEPVKANAAPVQPVRPVNPDPTPVRPVQPTRPIEPVKPASSPVRPVQPVNPNPAHPASHSQQLLDELDQDVRGGAQQVEPVQPLRPGRDHSRRPTARPTRTEPRSTRRDLPPYWYIDAILLGVTVLAVLGILANWNSVMDAAMQLIMTLADMAIAAIIVLGIALFVILALRRRYRWRRWWRL